MDINPPASLSYMYTMIGALHQQPHPLHHEPFTHICTTTHTHTHTQWEQELTEEHVKPWTTPARLPRRAVFAYLTRKYRNCLPQTCWQHKQLFMFYPTKVMPLIWNSSRAREREREIDSPFCFLPPLDKLICNLKDGWSMILSKNES